jgi:hypothetical protein
VLLEDAWKAQRLGFSGLFLADSMLARLARQRDAELAMECYDVGPPATSASE